MKKMNRIKYSQAHTQMYKCRREFSIYIYTDLRRQIHTHIDTQTHTNVIFNLFRIKDWYSAFKLHRTQEEDQATGLSLIQINPKSA